MQESSTNEENAAAQNINSNTKLKSVSMRFSNCYFELKIRNMDLIKDEMLNNPKSEGYYSGFQSKDGDNTIYFVDGVMEATAYSYEIGGVGRVDLNREQTYELFMVMRKFYDEVG